MGNSKNIKSLSRKELVDEIFQKLFDSESYLMREKQLAFPYTQRKKIENEVKRYLKENYNFDYSEEELDADEDIKRLINILKE